MGAPATPPPIPCNDSATSGRRFIGLHWKGFLWLSGLLLVLSAAFYGLSVEHLMRQFHAQREAEVQSFRRQVTGLFNRTADRLVRLGGAIVAMGDLGEALRSRSREQLSAVAARARYASLGYELEVQRLEVFAADGERVWRWMQTEAQDLPEARLTTVIAQVHTQERPATLLACQPVCLLHAFVPVLAQGENVGVIHLAQSIADLVIEFRTLTGADLGLVVPAPGTGGTAVPNWGGAIPALTDAARLSPLIEALTSLYPNPADLDRGKLVPWQAGTYDVQRLALAEFMPSEPGFVLFLSDVSARLEAIRGSAREVLLATAVALGVAELMLLYLVRVTVRRLRSFARTLPLLAQGAYAQARERFLAPRDTASFRDEIDALSETAVALSHQLEDHSRSLAEKNRELAEDRDFIQGLLASAQVLVVTQTRYGIIQIANEFAAQLTGYATGELRGRRFVDLIVDVQAHREVLSKLANLGANGDRRLEHEHELVRRDGERRQIVWVHTPLREVHTDGTAVLSVGLDVTDRVRAESQMRWLANHDTLTGLVNRHRFVEDLTRTLDEVGRSGATAALLLFDLDHFKEINDTSGHAAGDALLRLIAEELRARTRKSDVTARLGGDEFAVLMPNTDAYGAETFAGQFNQRLADAPFVYADKHYRVGASIGIALLPQHGTNVEELMTNADIAMYQAKRAGRARSQVFAAP